MEDNQEREIQTIPEGATTAPDSTGDSSPSTPAEGSTTSEPPTE